ncbi:MULTISPECIES: ABC transporter permease [Pimelobacter]|uniref:ABC transporter permease n=1 Tax=Pimelobacter TaxID=2044 RepID=UPI001C05303E|nr:MULTISPECIES: ABC transporter permease [Pimelobacter]MBU2697982.1 spermidine/putrescine ABC transporter permease [Pimelobacter sp. 30-1]UUW92364.1 ABC transporter permease [Pimelobacter simplex]UUW96192.1 ABC transporter permease [Pimelobacter simplex]
MKGRGAWTSFPVWAWLLFFIFIPLGLVAWYSFGYKPGLFSPVANDKLSLDRYGEALTGTFLRTFWNTLQIAGVGTALCVLIGVPFAYWMAVRTSPRIRGLLVALVLVPYWTSFLVRTIGWQIVLAPHGFLSQTLQDLHLIDGPLSVLYTRGAVQLGVVYNYLPLMILPLYVAFERTDPAQREAARDLGAGRWRTFFSVTLPDALPGLAAGCLLVFIPLTGDYITPSVLGGARGNMVGQMVAQQFESAQNWALGAAMAFVLMGFIIATVVVVGLVFLAARAVVRFRRRIDLEGVA